MRPPPGNGTRGAASPSVVSRVSVRIRQSAVAAVAPLKAPLKKMPAELRARCATTLAPAKLPELVVVVEAMLSWSDFAL